MNKATVVILLAAVVMGMGPVYASDSPMGTSTNTTTNATTIADSTMISPGSYVANIVPVFNSGMAARLEKAVSKIQGIQSVASSAADSTLHFTVKNGASVNLAEIQSAVSAADAGAVMSTPIMAHSMSTNPGL